MTTKNSIKLLSLAAFALSVTMSLSCNPQQVPDNTDGKPDDEQTEDNHTYSFVASPLKGKWEVGDKIYVHGTIGSWQQIITLEASNISSEDARIATAELGEQVLEKPADPDGLYAAWPDESVKHLKSRIGSKTTFETCDGMLTVAYLKDKTFTFKDVSSSFSFTVSGDYDQYALVSNSFSGLQFTSYEVDYTSKKISYNAPGNGIPYKYGKLESGAPTRIWLPANFEFKTGFILYVGKDGQWPLRYSHAGKLLMNPGENTDLGDITASLAQYSGPGPVVPQMGEKTTYKVKFNELSGLCMSADEDFLWSVGDQGELAQFDFEGHLLRSVALCWGDPEISHTKENRDKGKWGGYDTEGITVNPLTGDLLVSMEPNYVGVITNENLTDIFAADTTWNVVNTLFRIPDAADLENSGTEGITYYKDGQIYVGAQGWSSRKASLYRYDLNGNIELEIARLNQKFPSLTEVAGLCYDPLTDWLWVIDSNSPQKIFVLSGDATKVITVYPLEGTGNPESICVDHKNSCVWVGDDDDDDSYIYRYNFPDLNDFNLK